MVTRLRATSIATFTGKLFDPWNPRREDFDIRDVAHHLSLENRFGGATFFPYSVGQHSVLAARCVSEGQPELRLAALLHDAEEAYLKDIPKPYKQMFPEYVEVATKLREWIYQQCGVASMFWNDERIKEIDQILYSKERRACTPRGLSDAGGSSGTTRYDIRIEPWQWEYTKSQFLVEFDTLTERLTPRGNRNLGIAC